MTAWLKLTSQTAIITGAASGIGRATAIAIAEQGCNLLLADSNHDNLSVVATECKEAASNKECLISCTQCDVTNKTEVQNAIVCADELALNATPSSTSSSSSSKVASILVNCAGITRDAKVSNISNEDWDNVIDVNLKGTFLMCQAFCEPGRLNSLLSGGDGKSLGVGGSIINIGSIVSKYGNLGQVNYAASKGGVVGLTRSLAKEMALMSWKSANGIDFIGGNMSETGIMQPTVRVNCIQPGFIHTPMAHAVPERILSDMTRKIALRRLGQPKDVANLALFLASAERSGYITGEAFECSGMLRL